MLKLEYINQFLGFGANETKQGEYFFSQGMISNRGGIEPGWKVIADTNQTSITQLDLVNWFAERDESGTPYAYAVDEDGDIFRGADVKGTAPGWAFFKTPTATRHGNGLIVDHSSSQRLLYAQDEYLGMYDGSIWDSQWQDLGWSVNVPKPMDIYEDWVVIGNSSTVALLNITDDSFSYNSFNFPPNFIIRALKSGENGVLIGANFNERGILALWDCFSDRSIAPWLWTKGKIYGMAKYKGIWLVSTGREIILTNGYRILRTYTPPDLLNTDYNFGPVYPSGMDVDGDKLFILTDLSSIGGDNRKRKGVYILDLITELWEYVPLRGSDNHSIMHSNSAANAFFITNLNNYLVSFDESYFSPSDYLGRLYPSGSNINTFYISPKVGAGNELKEPEGIILDLGYALQNFNVWANPDITFTIKIYNFKRPLFCQCITNRLSPQLDEVAVDATNPDTNQAYVGDEITILEGSNGGEIRHITRISSTGLSDETWHLDSNLDHYTELYAHMIASPFKKVGEKTITQEEIIDSRVYIPIKKGITGRKFLIKIVCKAVNMRPHIEEIGFLYNQLKL